MGKDNIEKYSIRYRIIKVISGLWHNKVFYRKVIVLGRENINPEDHIIFAPNHQNALMDALAVLFTHKGQPVFLARADIFRKKLIAELLYFFKILPIYRIRDGFSNLKANDEIFNKTLDVFKNKNGLVILPEGNHEGQRKLRQLKKGICRIAFQSDEATGFNLKIKIIPVGVEYSNYTKYRQVLTVVYGKPLEISEYHELYKENPEKAYNELRKRLSEEMKKYMVHIESEDDYEAIDELRNIINGRFSDNVKSPKLFRDRILIDKINLLKLSDLELYKKICALSLSIKEKAARLKTDYRLLEKKEHKLFQLIAGIIGMILTLPVFLYGSIFNMIVLSIPNIQIRKIKDPQFHSSIRYGISLVVALICFLIFFILALIIFPSIWIGLLMFISFPLAGLFAWNYKLLLQRTIGGLRIRRLRRNNKEFILLKNNHNELTSIISTLAT